MSGDGLNACCVGTGAFFCWEGVAAASAATSGAIGFSVMNSAGWIVPGYNCANFTQAMTVGGLVLSIPTALCFSCAVSVAAAKDDAIDEDSLKSAASGGLVSAALGGALDGMAGAGMLGLLSTGTHIGYAAAAGAAGAAITAASIGTAACIVICCGGSFFICGQAMSNDPIIMRIPRENIITASDGQRRVTSLESLIPVQASDIGLNVADLQAFAAQVENNLQQTQVGTKAGAPSALSMTMA